MTDKHEWKFTESSEGLATINDAAPEGQPRTLGDLPTTTPSR
jgi:hypothetical protein